MSNVEPSRNPADSSSFSGAMRIVINKFLQSLNKKLPAKVIAFDESRNIATVQPMLMIKNTNGAFISRAQVPSIPVFQFGSGSAVLRCNLVPGDLGWIEAADRDISLFISRLEESGPNTNRLHSISDSVFVPDAIRGFSVSEEAGARMVIQNTDGSVRVSVFDSKLKLVAPTIEGVGNLVVDGSISATQNITSDADVLAGSISVLNHGHVYSWTGSPGSGVTDPPS